MAVGYEACFAFSEGECLCLKETLCALGKKCSFFKTKKQVESEKRKTEARISELGLTQGIKEKYNI